MNPVIAWLRTPEGQEWSRQWHAGTGTPSAVVMRLSWRAEGPLNADEDPCGAGPISAMEGQ